MRVYRRSGAIEAVQFTGEETPVELVPDMNIGKVERIGKYLWIVSGTHRMRAGKGDWILRSERGELSVIANAHFHQFFVIERDGNPGHGSGTLSGTARAGDGQTSILKDGTATRI